ncbi:HAMP domain-containing sensor histidine kinase [Chromobacterium sp. IIBBL 290-4]|uniref:sensor histidine kinase n=1 Tax=Chromobacterium sp. IIBBL 290-4 TaxID=2953890 RepID=UPI0020B8D835|nr:HAMP domain-containing sensor histidine kinase [Chromobacterium sp. IIBBL 290-4]UTH76233.1 HAMP domain-containing histidine kinase [Chromobacterium sp. IIBBL 290-4]
MSAGIRRSQGWQWLAYLFLAVLLPMLCFFYVQSTLFSKQVLEQAAGPGEGYYWAASQYRYAIQRMNIELSAYSLKEESYEELMLAHDVLRSKYLVLSRSVSPQLGTVQEYVGLLHRSEAFMREVDKLLPLVRDNPGAAIALRREFRDMTPVIADLVIAAHDEEVKLRDISINQTMRLRHFALISLITWALLAIFLGWELWKAIRRQEVIELQREAILAERQAHEEAVRMALARSTLLSTVSHEVLTPLHTIQGGVELLGEMVRNPRVGRTLANVRTAADYLSQLMQDLLDMGRLDAGRMMLRPGAFRADQLVASVVGEFRPVAEARGLSLAFEGCGLVRPVYADATRFRQIVSNLISNAVRYTDEGGIRVALSYESGTDDSWLLVTVSDTGIGIPESEQAGLFEPFVQLANGGPRGGAGMGLAIVARIAVLMNGGVRLVSSAPGKGSVFEIRLPLLWAPDAAA